CKDGRNVCTCINSSSRPGLKLEIDCLSSRVDCSHKRSCKIRIEEKIRIYNISGIRRRHSRSVAGSQYRNPRINVISRHDIMRRCPCIQSITTRRAVKMTGIIIEEKEAAIATIVSPGKKTPVLTVRLRSVPGVVNKVVVGIHIGSVTKLNG